MNGLNVLPLTPSIKNNEMANVLGSNTLSIEPMSEGFSVLFENLLQANQGKKEGQTEEELWNSLSIGLGIEGLLLNYPAGKEANSGILKGQGTDQRVVNSSDNTLGQFIQRLALEGLQTGMKQASSETGGIPQTELDRYKLEIIKLLHELNGKLELVSKPSPTATMMQVLAAGKVYTNELSNSGLRNALGHLPIQEAQPIFASSVTAPTVTPAVSTTPITSQFTSPMANPRANLRAKLTANEKVQDLDLSQVLIKTQSINTSSRSYQNLSISNQNFSISNQNPSLENEKSPYQLNILQNDNIIAAKQINSVDNRLPHSAILQPENGQGKTQLEQGHKETPANITESQEIDGPLLTVKEVEGGKTISITNAEKGTAPSIVQQMVQALHRQTDGLSQTPSLRNLRQVDRVEIQLNPADLGKVHVSVRFEDGQVHLFMQATESSTGSLLQHQLNDLRQTLTNLGVACGSFEMGLGEGQENSQGFQNHRQFEEARYEHAEITDESMNKDYPMYSEEMHGGSQVNVTA